MIDEPLVPLQDFDAMVPVMAGGKAVVKLTALGEEFEVHELAVQEAGVVGQISVFSGPREWSPRLKWPEGFIEISRLRWLSEDQVKRKDYESGLVYAVLGFIPNSSPFMMKLSEKG